MEKKTDCFAYTEEKCNALNKFYCQKEKCKFYQHKDNVDIREIERAVKEYVSKH